MNKVSRLTLVWCGLFCLAFINGAVRELFFIRIFSVTTALKLSILTLGVVIFLLVRLSVNKLCFRTSKDAWVAGIYWLVLTFLAETFIIGRLIGGKSYSEIFSSYDITSGELWPVILLWILIVPVILQKRHSSPERQLSENP